MTSRDIALAEATGGPGPHDARVQRRQRRLDSPRQGARGAGDHRSLSASLHAHRRMPAHVRRQLQNEPSFARTETCRRLHRRPGRRHDRRDLHRPRAARAGKENARARSSPVRHRRPGDRIGPGGHAANRARPSRLVAGVGQDDNQSGPHPGHRQRHAANRRRCRRDRHRSGRALDGRSHEVSFQERQHTVRGLEAPRPRRYGHRRRPDQVSIQRRTRNPPAGESRVRRCFRSRSRRLWPIASVFVHRLHEAGYRSAWKQRRTAWR